MLFPCILPYFSSLDDKSINSQQGHKKIVYRQKVLHQGKQPISGYCLKNVTISLQPSFVGGGGGCEISCLNIFFPLLAQISSGFT